MSTTWPADVPLPARSATDAELQAIRAALRTDSQLRETVEFQRWACAFAFRKLQTTTKRHCRRCGATTPSEFTRSPYTCDTCIKGGNR